jgi:hypothetical protein
LNEEGIDHRREQLFAHLFSPLLQEDGHKTEILEDIGSLLPKTGDKEFGLA